VCTSTSRIYVQESIYDQFVHLFVKTTQGAAKLGNSFSADVIQGPQVSKTQFDTILRYIEKGKSEGATLAAGGIRSGTKGYFIEPTIFTNVSLHSLLTLTCFFTNLL
jgi:aldehyde dehydrogenase (NAD+)